MLKKLGHLMRSRRKAVRAERVREVDQFRAPPGVKEAGLRRVLAEFGQMQPGRDEVAERRAQRRHDER